MNVWLLMTRPAMRPAMNQPCGNNGVPMRSAVPEVNVIDDNVVT